VTFLYAQDTVSDQASRRQTTRTSSACSFYVAPLSCSRRSQSMPCAGSTAWPASSAAGKVASRPSSAALVGAASSSSCNRISQSPFRPHHSRSDLKSPLTLRFSMKVMAQRGPLHAPVGLPPFTMGRVPTNGVVTASADQIRAIALLRQRTPGHGSDRLHMKTMHFT
jgi:hypothetical protein